jgi:hypothetical protein
MVIYMQCSSAELYMEDILPNDIGNRGFGEAGRDCVVITALYCPLSRQVEGF